MPSTRFTSLLLFCPIALSGQLAPKVGIVASSCASADSAVGPWPDKPMVFNALGVAGSRVKIGLPADPGKVRYGDLIPHLTIAASPAPPSAPSPPAELLVILSGDPARQLVAAGPPVSAPLTLKDDTVVTLTGTFPDIRVRAAGGMTLAFVSFPLDLPLVARLAKAKDAHLQVGPNKIDISKDIRKPLSEAYRAAVCGYVVSER